MDVDYIGLRIEMIIPDVFKQHDTRHHLVRMPHQRFEHETKNNIRDFAGSPAPAKRLARQTRCHRLFYLRRPCFIPMQNGQQAENCAGDAASAEMASGAAMAPNLMPSNSIPCRHSP
jgi:hypothetical protein